MKSRSLFRDYQNNCSQFYLDIIRNNNYAIHIQQAVSAGGGGPDGEPRLHRAGGAAGGRGHHHPHRRRLHQVQKVSGVLGNY